MITSPTIGAIAAALAAAQGEIRNPAKDKTAKIASAKGQYSYTYADFATSLDAIRPILAKHKLAIVQAPFMRENFVMLESRIIHESGEWLGNEYPVGMVADHRTMGSSLSYARRYALFPLLGVQGEDDDDGQADQERPRYEPRQSPATAGTTSMAPDIETLADTYVRKFNEAKDAEAFEGEVSKARAAWSRINADGRSKVLNSIEARRAFWRSQSQEAAE
jgi:hypothetical protein